MGFDDIFKEKPRFDFGYRPVNSIERKLLDYGSDPSLKSELTQMLLQSKLIVIGETETNPDNEPDFFMKPMLVNNEPVLHAWTSKDAFLASARLNPYLNDLGVLEVPARKVIEPIAESMDLVLNPSLSIATLLSPRDMLLMLQRDSKELSANSEEEGLRVQISMPSKLPLEFLVKLKEVLKQNPSVEDLYFGQMTIQLYSRYFVLVAPETSKYPAISDEISKLAKTCDLDKNIEIAPVTSVPPDSLSSLVSIRKLAAHLKS